MPRGDDQTRLRHMREAAEKALRSTNGRSRSDLDTDEQLSLSLVRLLEIIGEAAGRVTPETKAANPQIPSTQIIGTRNRLIHGYDVVDADILWERVATDVPGLVEQLRQVRIANPTEG